MIEKLDKFDSTEASIYHAEKLYAKVNQIVDAVNTIQKEREAERFEIKEWIDILEAVRKSVNKHEDIIRQIDEWGSNKGECLWCENLTKVNLDDPYAEQLKWIGCVCRFWYDNPDDTVLDYLGKIQTGENGIEYYGKETYDWFPHCEPVKPDDDIIYKGE